MAAWPRFALSWCFPVYLRIGYSSIQFSCAFHFLWRIGLRAAQCHVLSHHGRRIRRVARLVALPRTARTYRSNKFPKLSRRRHHSASSVYRLRATLAAAAAAAAAEDDVLSTGNVVIWMAAVDVCWRSVSYSRHSKVLSRTIDHLPRHY